jgi:hypothetical protein
MLVRDLSAKTREGVPLRQAESIVPIWEDFPQ